MSRYAGKGKGRGPGTCERCGEQAYCWCSGGPTLPLPPPPGFGKICPLCGEVRVGKGAWKGKEEGKGEGKDEGKMKGSFCGSVGAIAGRKDQGTQTEH